MEKTNYYAEYKDEMILRDVLAIDRTILANERTFLSYIRAFLNFIIGGISFIKLFDSNFIKNYYLTIKQKITLTELDSYVPSEFKMDLCHNLIDLDIFENDKNFEVSNMAKVKKYYT